MNIEDDNTLEVINADYQQVDDLDKENINDEENNEYWNTAINSYSILYKNLYKIINNTDDDLDLQIRTGIFNLSNLSKNNIIIALIINLIWTIFISVFYKSVHQDLNGI